MQVRISPCTTQHPPLLSTNHALYILRDFRSDRTLRFSKLYDVGIWTG